MLLAEKLKKWKINSKIKLVYWNFPNFGDQLSPFLVEKLTGKEIKYKSPYHICTNWLQAFRIFIYYMRKREFSKISTITFPSEHVLLSIGSILKFCSNNTIVWGSGFMSEEDSFKGGQIFAVRGEYTNVKLKRMGFGGCDVFGDPGLLIPLVYPVFKETKFILGIIPHWKEVDFFKDEYSKTYKVIDLLTKDVETVIDEIVSCKYILSTSLHGIIVAHAYGIPALWIKKGNIGTDGIKFKDYFSSVGIKPYDGLSNFDEFLSGHIHLDVIFDEYKDRVLPCIPIEVIQKSLLRVAPFEVLDKYAL